MSLPKNILTAQVQQLLELIERTKTDKITLVREQANKEAQSLLKQAFNSAKIKVRADIKASRQDMEKEIKIAHAHMETLAKQARYQAEEKVLDKAWDLLEKALLRRWMQETSRKAWIERVSSSALQYLLEATWNVTYAPGWSEAERMQWQQDLQTRNIRIAEFREQADLQAGLVVHAGLAVVDGSLQGLMYDRTGLQARLIAAYRSRAMREEFLTQPESKST